MCALGLLVLGVFHHPRKRPDKTPNWVADAGAGAVVDATGQERGRLLLWASRNTGRSDKDSATETRHWKLTRGLVEPRVFQGPVVRLREALIYPRTAKVTCTCGLGLDVHPIYWSDALAVEGMVAELRNWSHRSICRLRSLRGGTWVAKSTGPVGRWRGQAQPRESGTRRAPTGLLTTRASLKMAEGLCRNRAVECSGRRGRTRAVDGDEADPSGSTLVSVLLPVGLTRASRTWQLDVLVSPPAVRYMSSKQQARPDGKGAGRASSGGRSASLAPWARAGLMRWHA